MMLTLQERVTGIAPPSHWQPRKLKHVFRLRRGNKNDGLRETNLLSLSYGRIVRRDIQNTEGLVPASYEGYQIVYPGDIVLRLTDLQNDKRSLRQGLVTERGIVTSAYDVIFASEQDDSEYWYYFLYALDISKYYYSLGGGVRQSISFNDFPNDWIATPELTEQKNIALRIRKSLSVLSSIISEIGGNRSAQVAGDGSLLSLLLVRREALIVQSIMAAKATLDAEPADDLVQRAAAKVASAVKEEVEE